MAASKETVRYTANSFAEKKDPIDYLYDYTKKSEECQANPSCMGAITELITDRTTGKTVKESEEVIVYRGQRVSREIDPNFHPWFSTSTELNATETFRSDVCCVFKIHLMPGAKYIDVNELLVGSTKARGSVSAGRLAKEEYVTHGLHDEHEIIVLGGGTFYSSPDGTPGFKELKPGIFETWYSPIPLTAVHVTPSTSASAAVGGAGTAVAIKSPSKKKVTLAELKNRAMEIVGEDYDMLYGDAPNSNFLGYLNPGEELNENTTVGGARRKTRKPRRNRRKSRAIRRNKKN